MSFECTLGDFTFTRSTGCFLRLINCWKTPEAAAGINSPDSSSQFETTAMIISQKWAFQWLEDSSEFS